MTIQISIVVWTVICFLVLMLILKNLLFKPVLEVMDSRKEKIQRAQAKKAEEERLIAAHQQMLEEKRSALAKEQQKQIKAEAEKIRQESKQTIEQAKQDRLLEMEQYRTKTAEDHEEICAVLAPHTKELAAVFADKIISHQ